MNRGMRLGTAALIALAAAVVGPAASAAAPSMPGTDVTGPENGRIAFVRDGAIYSMNSNGSDVDQLTSGPADSNPEWSPDGTEIVFIRTDAGGNSSLVLMDEDGDNESTLTASVATVSRIAWSANGRFIAFDGPCVVSKMDAYGCAGVKSGLDLITMDGPERTVSTVFRSDGSAVGVTGGVAFSTDSRYLAYETADVLGIEHTIAVLDLQTGKDIWSVECGGPLSECDGYVALPTFSRTGPWIAFDSYKDYDQNQYVDYYGIERQTLRGGVSTPFRQSFGDHYLAFSPKGDRTAFVHGEAQPWIMVGNALGDHAERIAIGTQPAWQPL